MRSRVTLALAVAYLIFAFLISLTWYLPVAGNYVPHWLEEVIYPIDKVNLDVLRFAHFLALAVVTVHYVPRDWPLLKSRWLWPPIMCGQKSAAIALPEGVALSKASRPASLSSQMSETTAPDRSHHSQPISICSQDFALPTLLRPGFHVAAI